MDLYHCKANRIIIGGIDTLGNMTYSNTQTYILRPNAEVSAIYDYYSTASANNATYCQNASRSLIFDGYSGSIAWYHLGLNNTDVANGVNRIELKNNATITFTHTNPRLKTGGVFHMESGSSLTAESLLPVGLVNTNGTETVYPYTEVLTGIDYTFNGSIWYGICGNTLGSSIRVKTPYGIRFGFEIDEADIENKTGLTVTRKGVLMIPQTILNGDLCHTTSSVLEIEATLPLSANNPNQFTACLVDSISNPGVGWLETWANVSFATRGYAVLSNGAVLYTDYVINSIQNIWDILEARSGISDSDDWSAFLDVPVQNQTGVTNLVSRAYYPEAYSLLSKLETLRKSLGKDLTTAAAIRSELGKLFAACTDLGLYGDYYLQPYATGNGNLYFGANSGANPIGGGSGYVSGISGSATYTVTDDNTLKAALDQAVSGDIILVSGEVVIDLADFILAGDPEGFTGTKIPYQFTVPAGVTLMGLRGENGSGAILKTTSYVENMLYMKDGSRISGLVLMGPDLGRDSSVTAENLSGAVKVAGNHVTIDNCEIAGFYRSCITADNVNALTVSYNYIHHCLGNTSGLALNINQTDVTARGNLFVHVRRIAALRGKDTSFTYVANVESSNDETTLFALHAATGFDPDYHPARKGVKSITVSGNTFLSKANLFWYGGIPQDTFIIRYNWFAYPESSYVQNQLAPGGGAAGMFNGRMLMYDNLFGVSYPVVVSKDDTAPEIPSDSRLGRYSLIQSYPLTMPAAVVNSAVTVRYSSPLRAPVLSASYYLDQSDAPYQTLKNLVLNCSSMTYTEIAENVIAVMQGIGCYSNYLTWHDNEALSTKVDGKVYGAYEYNGEPLGGGVGYSDIYTTGDYIVTNEEELRDALAAAKPGEVVFIPGYVQMEIGNANAGTSNTLNISKGVTLASDRGYVYPDGRVSTGALLTTSTFSSDVLITVAEEDVRITGLTIQGPDPGQHLAHHKRSFSTYPRTTHGYTYYYMLRMVTGIYVSANRFEFDNCELSAFNYAAIALRQNTLNMATTGILIHNNYIHHNQINGLGYGVTITRSYAEIYSNLFNFNRHSIAGSGYPDSGYKAFCNVEFGQSLSTYFDMHGGYDRNKNYDEEIAGEYVEIYNNTFLGSNHPYNLRGFPTSHRTFEYNICYLSFEDYGNVFPEHSRLEYYWYRDVFVTNNYIGKNIWNVSSDPIWMDHGYGENYAVIIPGWEQLLGR